MLADKDEKGELIVEDLEVLFQVCLNVDQFDDEMNNLNRLLASTKKSSSLTRPLIKGVLQQELAEGARLFRAQLFIDH